MFDYSYNLMLPCQECTAAEFERLVTSDRVRGAIARARQCETQMQALAEGSAERKALESEKAKAKRSLPCIMFQATFKESTSKSGKKAKWRSNANAVLNGLFIVDIDHVQNPREEYRTIMDAATKLGIADILMLAFITASGHGLKLVCKADAAHGDIEGNQKWLCSALCIEFDEACKDAARVSFCPAKEDILFINEEIFTYDNESFRSKERRSKEESSEERRSKEESSEERRSKEGSSKEGSSKELHADFHGVPYARIVGEWEKVKGGRAVPGTRHHRMLEMAADFRHICDMDAAQLVRVMRLSETARELEAANPREIEDIAAGAVRLRNSVKFPPAIVEACKNCGIPLTDAEADGLAQQQDEIDYDYWWSRLRPLLHPSQGDAPLLDPYAAAVAQLDDNIKLGGVLAAGAMLGTYLSRCSFTHYDGKPYRLSYMVYVVGAPASGKSFIIDLDRVLMSVIKKEDEIWRERERQYAEQKEKNEQTKGTKESKVMEKPHFPIRYVPSTISNHVLYNRLRDAVVPGDESGTHLHLFTLESELATALRSQVGSWAGKLDLELKSFQNEYAGVDFANVGSANGLIQINWNQVISTTMDSMLKKVRGNSINDGLVTRLALWQMPDNDGQMIPYRGDNPIKTGADNGDEGRLATLCRRLSTLQGNLPCEPLVRCAYDWCEKQCENYALTEDRLIDYFRNRIPLYMVRYTLPRIVARDIDLFTARGELTVTEEDKQFARLIGDWLMYISIRTWGRQLLDYWENGATGGMPRQRKSKLMDFYAALGDEFSFDDVRKYYRREQSARNLLSVLIKKNYIRKTDKNKWKKLVSTLDENIYR